MKGRIFLLLISMMLSMSCNSVKHNVQENHPSLVGARSSYYGIDPFPDPKGWVKAITSLNESFHGSTPSAVWIVGTISSLSGKYYCSLNFANDSGRKYDKIKFWNNVDKNEEYLDLFDKKGFKIFLQVESGDADIVDLIDIVMNRYKHHPCVIGFGVDVEWYKIKDTDGSGTKVTNENAKLWNDTLKAHGENYQLFLKHWDPEWMPETYRGDLVFVNDSQGFSSIAQMVNEFDSGWAKLFYPNTVIFQIGYEADYNIWKGMKNPPHDLGLILGKNVKQEYGIIWVDFTLSEVAPVR